LNIEKYHSERRRLRDQAKAMMEHQENPEASLED
jgi:hypothetical protein